MKSHIIHTHAHTLTCMYAYMDTHVQTHTHTHTQCLTIYSIWSRGLFRFLSIESVISGCFGAACRLCGLRPDVPGFRPSGLGCTSTLWQTFSAGWPCAVLRQGKDIQSWEVRINPVYTDTCIYTLHMCKRYSLFYPILRLNIITLWQPWHIIWFKKNTAVV